MKIMTMFFLVFLSVNVLATENSCEWSESFTCNGQFVSDSCLRECAEGIYTGSGYEVLTGVSCEPIKCENEKVVEGTCGCNYQKVD